MSRSGYSDDFDDHWRAILYRGAVAAAIKGKRGQAFFREMLQALDALPEKKLIADELEAHGAVCAIGAVGKARGVDMTGVDAEDSERVARLFGIAESLAREIVYENDEVGYWRKETPEARFARMRKWVADQILPSPSPVLQPTNRERDDDQPTTRMRRGRTTAMSYTDMSARKVEALARAKLDDIETARSRMRAENAATRWWQTAPHHELRVLCYAGRQEQRCERLLALCELATDGTIRLSAEDAEAIAP